MSSVVGERIRTIREGVSQDEFARRLGIHKNTLGAYERGQRTPDAVLLARICQEFGVDPGWLLLGSQTVQDAANDPELVMVPKVKARLSAGSGSLETSGEVKGRFAFRSEWIRAKGQPGRMVLMDVTGESMEPVIWEGDTVLIDQAQADVMAGKIYAVGIDEEVVVKYVDKEPGKYILRSANKEYKPIEVTLSEDADNVRIIGRVVWWCREAR